MHKLLFFNIIKTETEKERMDKEKRSGHALVLPYPAQGHINPMLQFSKRLIATNAKVTFANTVYIASSSFLAKPCNPDSLIDFDTISDGFDQGGISQAPSDDAYLSSLRIIGSQTLVNLIKKLDASGNPVDAVVYDGFMPWALDVARDFGVLGVVFFTQSCAVNNVYYHVHRGLVSLPPPDDQSSSSPLSIPGLPLLQSWESPNPRQFFDLIVDQFSNVDQADYVFFNTFHDLEKEVVEWLGKMWKVRTIGPTLPSMYLDKRLVDDRDYGVNLFKPNTGASMDWLKDKPIGSVVYVSFGSMAELESKQMEEIAWGLKDGNFNFLWVVRASEAAKLPNNLANELNSEKGLVVTWSPQVEILANESVGCFVTHCGFNSVLEGLSLGVPMVAMPQWTDQPINAKYVEQVWGTGVRARPDDKGIVSREVVESCIRQVLEGDEGKEMKKNALNWKNLARQAIDEGGTSDLNIKQFAAELFLRRSTC